jgi:16S rRNA (guanine527-N7)-methyltransferase
MDTEQELSASFKEILSGLSRRHGVSPSEEQLGVMDIHRKLLQTWGARMNLTAIRDPEDVARRHFLEGILAGDLLRRRRATPPLLDLGSGNGFPAVPVAAMAEQLRPLLLVESSSRRAAFLRALLRELRWKEARVVVRRVEKGRDLLDLPCLSFTVRGVRPFRLLEEGLPFLQPGGACLLFMRQSVLEAEIPGLLSRFRLEEEVELEGRESGILLLRKSR